MHAGAALEELDGVIRQLEVFPTWLSDMIDIATDRVNSVLSAVPSVLRAVVDEIVTLARNLLARIAVLTAEIIAWHIEHVLPVLAGPMALYETGNRWTTTVYRQLTEVSGRIDLSNTRLEDYWQGPAASAYEQTVASQKAATDKMSETVSSTRTAIQGLALSLGALYIALAAGLVAASIQIAGGSAAVATVVGIPAGLVAIVAGLATGTATIGTVYAAGHQLIAGTAEEFATLLELKNDSSAFDRGRWPQSTGDLADGSAQDGTRSKWEMKR